MCKHDEETANHLLLHYDVAKDLWSVILLCLGYMGVLSIDKGCSMFVEGNQSKRRKKSWNLAPLAVTLIIWREPNKRTFEGTSYFT